jgi:hypothetical protein
MHTILLTMALLLQSLYPTIETENPRLFCWDASVNATEYHVYWSASPDWWPSSNTTSTSSLCVTDPLPDPIPGEVLFFVVTALNAYGESETDHGPIV